MTGYRGRLAGPASSAPPGLEDAVQRARPYRQALAVVCNSDHVLVSVIDTAMGRVALWNPSSKFHDSDEDRNRLTGVEWVQVLATAGNGHIMRARCRCTSANIDLDALLAHEGATRRGRVQVAAVAVR